MSFSNRIDERTAAKRLARKPALEPVKDPKDLFERRPLGNAAGDGAARQIGDDQRVLGREIIIERAFADSDLGGDRVDPDGANALPVEQPVGCLEDSLLHCLPGGIAARHHEDHIPVGFGIATQIGVVKRGPTRELAVRLRGGITDEKNQGMKLLLVGAAGFEPSTSH